MAIRISPTHKHGKVTMQSGHFYTFKYQGFKHDPKPHIIFINKWEGTHPNTGNQMRFVQAINLNYIPRQDRKRFVEDWMEQFQKSKSTEFTWNLVKRKYPYLKFAIRRYFWKPPYYISNLEYLDTIEKINKTIVGNWAKDFSKNIKMKLAQFFKRF